MAPTTTNAAPATTTTLTTFGLPTEYGTFSNATASAFQAAVDLEFQAATERAGISVAVFDGSRLWTYATGTAGGGRDMTAATPLAMESTSKTVLGALILRQIDDGLYSLDDPISAVLGNHPDYPGLDKQMINVDVTVEQLLRMASGHGHIWRNSNWTLNVSNRPTWKPAYLLAELIFPFGTPGTIDYKDTDPHLLGMIAEQQGGDTLNNLYRQRFFEPLNLSAVLRPQDALPAGIANPHGDRSEEPMYMQQGFGDLVEATWWIDFWPVNGRLGWANSGIKTTAESSARWAYELFSSSGRAVSTSVRSQMFAAVSEESVPLDGVLQQYGYHFAQRNLPLADGSSVTVFGAPGGGEGNSSNMRYSTADDLSFAILANSPLRWQGTCNAVGFAPGIRDCMMIRLLEAFRG